MATALEPKKIGPYSLLSILGSGGMGTVYLALHQGVGGFEKRVAIKCINAHVADDKQFITMLVDEAKLTAMLAHPNIVQVIDLAHTDGLHYLVMEYVEGIDVSTLADAHELDVDEAVYLIAEAARGLAYAHRKSGDNGAPLGIVHRDISGHNLLVSSEGMTKILDFGIAKAASNRTTTQIGMLKGKLAYMSPEQALGKPLDHRSDIFSLGVVLWELCTRQRMFQGDTDIQVLLKVQRCEVEPPSRLVDGFPQALETIILKTLAALPEQRYADGDRLADDLHEFLRSHQGAVPPRVKLAQRVSSYLRSHPLKPMISDAPTATRNAPAFDGQTLAGKTLASNRPDATRLVTPTGTAQMKTKVTRRPWLLLLPLLVLAVGTVGWLYLSKPNPGGTQSMGTAVFPANIPTNNESTAPHTQPLHATPPVEVSNDKKIDVSEPHNPIAESISDSVAADKPIERSERSTSRKETPEPAAKAQHKPKPVPVAVVAPPISKEAPAATENGWLSLNARPWAKVFINGKAIADSTPVLKYSLTAGSHKVTLVNPEIRARKEITIDIASGQHVRQVIDMQTGDPK